MLLQHEVRRIVLFFQSTVLRSIIWSEADAFSSCSDDTKNSSMNDALSGNEFFKNYPSQIVPQEELLSYYDRASPSVALTEIHP